MSSCRGVWRTAMRVLPCGDTAQWRRAQKRAAAARWRVQRAPLDVRRCSPLELSRRSRIETAGPAPNPSVQPSRYELAMKGRNAALIERYHPSYRSPKLRYQSLLDQLVDSNTVWLELGCGKRVCS